MSIQDDLKRQVASEIDRRGDELIRVAKTILGHPESGFRETRTSQLVHEKLQEFNIPHLACHRVRVHVA